MARRSGSRRRSARTVRSFLRFLLLYSSVTIMCNCDYSCAPPGQSTDCLSDLDMIKTRLIPPPVLLSCCPAVLSLCVCGVQASVRARSKLMCSSSRSIRRKLAGRRGQPRSRPSSNSRVHSTRATRFRSCLPMRNVWRGGAAPSAFFACKCCCVRECKCRPCCRPSV